MSGTIKKNLINQITNTKIDWFLTFTLCEKTYAIQTMFVQEVKKFSEVQQMNNLPPHYIGYISAQNNKVPVVDMRLRFGLNPKPHENNEAVIIVKVVGILVAYVVDMIDDIVTIPTYEDEITGGVLNEEIASRFVKGAIVTENNRIAVVSLYKLMYQQEIMQVLQLLS